MKCKQCGLDVQQKQGKQGKVFCNDRCRMAFKRATPNIPTPNIPTPNPQKSTPEQIDKNPDNIPGICHGCGIDTHWDICDICSECIAMWNAFKYQTRRK